MMMMTGNAAVICFRILKLALLILSIEYFNSGNSEPSIPFPPKSNAYFVTVLQRLN